MKRQSLRTIVGEQQEQVETPPSVTQAQPTTSKIERIKPGYSLRKDLIKQIKQIALDEEQPIYVIIEEAMQMLIESRKKQ